MGYSSYVSLVGNTGFSILHEDILSSNVQLSSNYSQWIPLKSCPKHFLKRHAKNQVKSKSHIICYNLLNYVLLDHGGKQTSKDMRFAYGTEIFSDNTSNGKAFFKAASACTTLQNVHSTKNYIFIQKLSQTSKRLLNRNHAIIFLLIKQRVNLSLQ